MTHRQLRRARLNLAAVIAAAALLLYVLHLGAQTEPELLLEDSSRQIATQH